MYTLPFTVICFPYNTNSNELLQNNKTIVLEIKLNTFFFAYNLVAELWLLTIFFYCKKDDAK